MTTEKRNILFLEISTQLYRIKTYQNAALERGVKDTFSACIWFEECKAVFKQVDALHAPRHSAYR